MSLYLQKLYDNRFDTREKKQKDSTWAEICRYIERVVLKNGG